MKLKVLRNDLFSCLTAFRGLQFFVEKKKEADVNFVKEKLTPLLQNYAAAHTKILGRDVITAA